MKRCVNGDDEVAGVQEHDGEESGGTFSLRSIGWKSTFTFALNFTGGSGGHVL